MAEQQDTTQLIMVVDGDYLYKSFKDVLGRPPTSADRTDFEQLKRYAARQREGGYLVTARYFQRRQPAAAFYAALERFGYELILTEYADYESWRIVKRNIIAELEQLRESDSDLLYVGGDSYAGEITDALRSVKTRANGSPRRLSIVHFEQRTDFDAAEFETYDIVLDAEAVPPHVYSESELRTRYPEGYLRPAARPAPSAAAAPIAAQPPAAQPPAVPPREAAAPAAPAQAEAAGSGAAAAPAPRNVLVLIDAENIDGHLAEIIAPEPLNRHTRPQWGRLLEYATGRAQGGAVMIKSFHQHHETIAGYAQYLSFELGIDPVILNPEEDPHEEGKRRPVVDEAIDKVLGEAAGRYCDVVVVSHDAGYLEPLAQVRRESVDPSRRFGLIGFEDRMPTVYHQTEWLERIDLERDIGAFSYELPRRFLAVSIDQFDAAASLGAFGAAPPRTQDGAAADSAQSAQRAPAG